MGEWTREWISAWRVFRRAPGYAAVIVLTLGLGIGANSAIFSAINGVLLQPLPYEHGDRLVRVQAGPVTPAGTPTGLSPMELVDYRERSNVVTDLVEYHTMFFNLLEEGADPERMQVGVVSWDFFQVMGVPPLHGRLFSPEEDHVDAEPVLLLGYDTWVRRYGADPSVVGRMVEMNNRPHRIVGVLPQVPTYPNQNDVWMPWYACPFRVGPGWHENRAARNLLTVGRFREGADHDMAHADVEQIAHDLHDEFADTYPAEAEVAASVIPLKELLTRDARPTFLILMSMAGLVLLIACANVANLTLTRMNRRRHEIAVRAALGAGRMRLARQFVTESVVLSLVGAVVAAGVAWGTVGILSNFAADLTPRFAEVGVDGWVLGFTALVALATGVLLGLAPLALDRRMGTTLREGKGSSGVGVTRVRGALVSLQVGFAVVLLLGAGLMVRSFAALTAVDPGFESEDVLTVTLDLDWARYTTAAERRDFFVQLLDRVEDRPGVVSAALANDFPMSGATFQNQAGLDVEGSPRAAGAQAPTVGLRSVSGAYFETLGIELLAGRAFETGDLSTSAPVGIVSRSLAERHLGQGNAIGRRISTDGGQSWITVVGVVDDVRQGGFDAEPGVDLYRPFLQSPNVRRLLVKTRGGNASGLARPITEDVLALDPRQPVSFVQTLEEAQADRVASPRTVTGLLTLFSIVALVTAGAGLFSVIAFSVQQRQRETGIRLALGEERASIVRRILRRGLVLVGIGWLGGLAVAALSVRVLERLLFGVQGTDPVTWIAVSAVLLLVSVLAIGGPALSATRISPMRTLRTE